MINLIKFKANTRIEENPGTVVLSANGSIRFGVLACEEIGITIDSYLNCHMDSDNPLHGYLEFSKHTKNSIEGYKGASAANKEGAEASIVFNPVAFLKRLKVNLGEVKRYKYEIIQIGTKDYVKIDFGNPIGGEISNVEQ